MTVNFASVEAPNKGYRLTVTPHGLSRCGVIVAMVTGREKAIPLASIFEGISQPELRPAQILSGYHDKVYWLVDTEAGEKLRH